MRLLLELLLDLRHLRPHSLLDLTALLAEAVLGAFLVLLDRALGLLQRALGLANRVVPDGAVLIRGDRIAAVGPLAELRREIG